MPEGQKSKVKEVTWSCEQVAIARSYSGVCLRGSARRPDCIMFPSRRGREAEHAGPHLDELGLVQVTVAVRVEHVDEVARHRLVEAHQLLQHAAHLILTQHPVAVSVQLVETRRYLVVTARIYTQQNNSLRNIHISLWWGR